MKKYRSYSCAIDRFSVLYKHTILTMCLYNHNVLIEYCTFYVLALINMPRRFSLIKPRKATEIPEVIEEEKNVELLSYKKFHLDIPVHDYVKVTTREEEQQLKKKKRASILKRMSDSVTNSRHSFVSCNYYNSKRFPAGRFSLRK